MAVANGWIIVKRSAATPGLADICNGGRVYPSAMAAITATLALINAWKASGADIGWICTNSDADCIVYDIYDPIPNAFTMSYVIAPLIAMHTFRG